MSSSKDKTFFAVILLVAGCAGFIQELTLYHGQGCTGAAVTIQTKEANLTNWESFLPFVQSYKVHGYWVFYSEPNFISVRIHAGYKSSPHCVNSTTPRIIRSLRFLGPLESSTPALAIYDGVSMDARELIFTTGLANNFGLSAKSAVASGTSAWTLYYNADFTGNVTRISGGGGLVSTSATFRSAFMGCNTGKETSNVAFIGNEPKFHYG